jgi:hypothetical protein
MMRTVAPLVFLALALPAGAQFTLAPSEAKRQMTTRASIVRGALKRQDMKTLARLVHPTKGLRFPNGCSREGKLGAGPTFTPAQVEKLLTNPTKYNWGADGESAAVVKATFKERYGFLWDRDYQKPDETNFNINKTRPQNYVKSLDKAFPGCVCVEFFVKGTAKNSETSWGSLWLVFEPYQQGWRLTAILRDYQGI